MTRRFPFSILAILLMALHCSADPAEKLSGKYILAERPAGVEAFDELEFLPDGKCVVTVEKSGAVSASFSLDRDLLTIRAPGATPSNFTAQFRALERTLQLTRPDGLQLFYVRPPQAPHPTFSEVTGIFHMHSELGDSSTEITAERRFRSHLHNFLQSERVYQDVTFEGTCTYADGVITYRPQRSNAPQQDEYIRDFVLKRSDRGMLMVDPYLDGVLAAKFKETMDLPAPPKGYRLQEEPFQSKTSP